MRHPHASIRAKERYGVDLTPNDLRRLAETIADGNSMVLDNTNPRGIHHAVKIGADGPMVRVIYNPIRRMIVTILPIKRESLTLRSAR